MTLKLNKVPPQRCESEIATYTASVEEKLSAGPGPDVRTRRRYYTQLGNFLLWLGLYEYMAERPDWVVVDHLARAADIRQEMYEHQQAHGGTGYGSLWSFEGALALSECFGAPERRATIDKIPETAYRFPALPKDDHYALYVHALKLAVARGSIEETSLARAREACERKPGPDRITMLIRALAALASGDSADFNLHLTALVRHHTAGTESGELSDSTDGFICMSGMALGGLARRLGVPVIVNSHYLPLRLLALRGDLHS
jgi:hypothetical protein